MMAFARSNRIPRIFVSILIILIFGTHALEDHYSNSFISPNSAGNLEEEDFRQIQPTRTSGNAAIHSRLLRSAYDSSDSLSSQIHTSAVVTGDQHEIEKREANPVLSKTSHTDDLILYKNVEEVLDNNDVELSGRIGGFIQPSKTDSYSPVVIAAHTSLDEESGEGEGAPQLQARSLREPPQARETVSGATPTRVQDFVSRSGPQPRQANPDIQDIITGLVKLLNGNVNVQANTAPAMGRPLRPLSTRINNRGPPRITDMPALPPDFDVPAPLPPPALGPMPPPLTTTRLPAPYPFDVPPNHHTSPAGTRPFYRPPTSNGNGPPWKRRRPPPHKPPPYKPLPVDMVSLTSEKPVDEDILTLDLWSHLGEDKMEGEGEQTGNATEVPEGDGGTEVDKEIAEFEKNKEKVTKLDKYTSKTTIVTPTFNTHSVPDSSTTAREQPSHTDIISTTPLESKMSTTSATDSSISITSTAVPEPSQTTTTGAHVTSTSANSNETRSSDVPLVESSIGEVAQTVKDELLGDSSSLAGMETEKLPITSTVLSSTSSTIEVNASSGIESSSSSVIQTTNETSSPPAEAGFPYYPYRPRPGIVLDDTEYKPGGGAQRPPIVTRPPLGQLGDIFDITVSAIQGPGGGASQGQGKPYVIPVDIDNMHQLDANADVHRDVITSSVGDEGFVSIDGKRTYLNLFGGDEPPSTSAAAVATAIKPTAPAHNRVSGTGYAVVEDDKVEKLSSGKPAVRKPPAYGRPAARPSQPPVRIDTCIVGDDTTCDMSQHEICRTESGVSACHCRPGTSRRKHRDPCRRIVSILLSLRVDKLYDRKVVWAGELADEDSASYRQLSFEAERALDSAMSMTPFSDDFLAAKVNGIYRGDRSKGRAGVFVNATLQLDENADTSRPTVRGDIQRHLLGVIQRRGNNVGESALWVDSPPGAVSNLQDVDECSSPDLHDCHSDAICVNVFGGFKCECRDGFKDAWADNKHRRGRQCEQCSPQHCNNRGECKYQGGLEVCTCTGNYYGNQCELDGEVLGVAIGASVAAVIIIGLTLLCLVMWSRRWSREQKAAVGNPVFGYMATASNTVKTPVVGGPPYQLTLEDRLRWAQIADVMAQANHYAPEPVLPVPTRPSSAMFGYPGGGPMSPHHPHHHQHGTLPPVPLPRLNLHSQLGGGRAATLQAGAGRPPPPFDNSSSSDEEDKADLLGRSFQVPRPKSRSNASVANQSGIYYDVDYEPNDIYKQSGGIPLSTYSMGRPSYFRN